MNYTLIASHLIDVNSLEDFGDYANQRELWTSLNPSPPPLACAVINHSIFKNWVGCLRRRVLYPPGVETLAKQRSYLDNRISRFMNIAKPGGVSTELGNFYFCRHPEFLPGKTQAASGFFGVNVNTGVAEYFENNSQPLDDRLTVRIHRKNNTISKRGFRYINKDVFIKQYPDAKSEGKSTYKLTQEQLGNLPFNQED